MSRKSSMKFYTPIYHACILYEQINKGSRSVTRSASLVYLLYMILTINEPFIEMPAPILLPLGPENIFPSK